MGRHRHLHKAVERHFEKFACLKAASVLQGIPVIIDDHFEQAKVHAFDGDRPLAPGNN